MPTGAASLWSLIYSGSLELMGFFGPLVVVALGLILGERFAPMASPIIRRAGGIFAVRLGFKAGGSRGAKDAPRTANVKTSTKQGGGVS